jgi:hypothetical protein
MPRGGAGLLFCLPPDAMSCWIGEAAGAADAGGVGMAKPNGAGGREPDVVRIIRRNKLKLDAIRSTFTLPSMLSLSNASEEIAKAQAVWGGDHNVPPAIQLPQPVRGCDTLGL